MRRILFFLCIVVLGASCEPLFCGNQSEQSDNPQIGIILVDDNGNDLITDSISASKIQLTANEGLELLPTNLDDIKNSIAVIAGRYVILFLTPVHNFGSAYIVFEEQTDTLEVYMKTPRCDRSYLDYFTYNGNLYEGIPTQSVYEVIR